MQRAVVLTHIVNDNSFKILIKNKLNVQKLKIDENYSLKTPIAEMICRFSHFRVFQHSCVLSVSIFGL